MAHTLEELESLLEGRALVGRVLHEEPGTDHEITDVRYFRQTRIVTLKLATGDCAFTLKDVEALLDGQKVEGMGKHWNKAYTLLPAEEEPGKAKVPNLITEHDCFMSAVAKEAETEVPTERPTIEKEEELRKALLGRCVLLQKDGTAQEVWGLHVTNLGGVVLKTDAGHFMLPNKAALEIFLDGGRAKCAPVIPKSKQEVFKDCCLLPEGWKPLKSMPAKPALPAKWEERWWDVCLRCYAKGFPNAHNAEAAAKAADKAVDIARKHLEGEG